jgi:hypothetical protein
LISKSELRRRDRPARFFLYKKAHPDLIEGREHGARFDQVLFYLSRTLPDFGKRSKTPGSG